MTHNQDWAAGVREYTEKKWEEETKAPESMVLLPSGPFPFRILACPQCNIVGFYGPRKAQEGEGTRKYRACKFCGFWQEASGTVRDERGGEPYRCVAIRCDKCQAYDWQVPWASEIKRCETCGAEMKKIDWASDDPKHPFIKIRDQIAQVAQALQK